MSDGARRVRKRPYFDTDITDLAGVLQLGNVIFDSAGAAAEKERRRDPHRSRARRHPQPGAKAATSRARRPAADRDPDKVAGNTSSRK